MHWLDFLFTPRADEITVRNISTDDFLALVVPRLVPETRPGTVALIPFHDPRGRAVIHEAKYRGNTHAHELLGSALAEYLRDADEISAKSSVVIVPIPLGKRRFKERGFNQAEEIACCALRSLGEGWGGAVIVDASLLARTRETISQVSLPRHKREKNMRGAFGAAHSVNPSATYIILDDVLTTGATLQAAIDALKKSGAKEIIPLALAH
jgi:ComF family protein